MRYQLILGRGPILEFVSLILYTTVRVRTNDGCFGYGVSKREYDPRDCWGLYLQFTSEPLCILLYEDADSLTCKNGWLIKCKGANYQALLPDRLPAFLIRSMQQPLALSGG